MARDHGRIRLDIWADDDWRLLPSLSQWLYMHLVSSPSLSFCGVADWRPARIAPLASDLTAFDVEYAAAFLEADQFVIIDRGTEEVLVRSYVKHDGLLASPNITKAMLRSYAAVASPILRRVFVGQMIRLHEKQPDLVGWKVARNLLDFPSLGVPEALANLSPNPSTKGSDNPSSTPSADPSPNGSATPSRFRPLLPTPYSLLPTPLSNPNHLPGERHQEEAHGALNLET